jgi:hypothetical protein
VWQNNIKHIDTGAASYGRPSARRNEGAMPSPVISGACLLDSGRNEFSKMNSENPADMRYLPASTCVMKSISRVMKTISHVTEPVSHVMEIISHVMEAISHVMEIISHVMETISHVMEIISHVMKIISRVMEIISHADFPSSCACVNYSRLILIK